MPDIEVSVARGHALALMALVGRGQSCSAGLTAATIRDEPTTIMTRADAAPYAAKHQGRNRSEILLAY